MLDTGPLFIAKLYVFEIMWTKSYDGQVQIQGIYPVLLHHDTLLLCFLFVNVYNL